MSEATAFPLSFSQKRLWLVEQMEPGGAQYAMPLAVDIDGHLDEGYLQQSLQAIVDRHEILRTTFTVLDDEAVQLIADAGSLPLQVHEFSGEVDPEARAEAAMKQVARGSFDLQKGPLVLAHLFRLGPRRAVLLVDMHHIVSDGWSLGVFFKELVACYGACAAGTPIALPELEVQYADFTEWQQEWFDNGGMNDQLAWWLKALDAASFLLPLHTDFSRPPTQTFDGASASATWDPTLLGEAEALARRLRTTPFVVLLSAYAVLLARYTGQLDILIGTPIANRNRGEVEPLIGFFVNTLPLRADLSGNPSFETLVGRVHDYAMEAYRHQDIPFEKLVEELNPERDLSHSPIFQVLFTLESGDLKTTEAAGLRWSPRTIDNGTCKFDLGLSLRRTETGAGADLRFNTNLFEKETADRLLSHYGQVASSLLSKPETSIWSHDLLPDRERTYLCRTLNHTDRDTPGQPVHQRFEAWAATHPHAPALVAADRALDYAETNRAANRLARLLRALGVGRETPVAVCMEPSVDMFVAKLAILKAGGAYLPMDPKYPLDRLAFMLQDMGEPILLTQHALLGLLPQTRAQVVAVDAPQTRLPDEAENLGIAVDPAQAAYVIYTSGSTGRPKGVTLTHAGLESLVSWHIRVFEVVPTDRSAQFAGPAFDAAVWSMWPYLSGGASIYVPHEMLRVSAAEVPGWLAANGITLCFLPTPLAEAMLHVAEPPGLALRYLLTGGDKLNQNPRPGASFRLVNNYGPTEGTVVTTSHLVDSDEILPPPIGKPIDNNRIYVLDPWGQAAPTGVPGELFVGGACLARAYHNQPALTAARFLPDPFSERPGARMYRTGDLVKWAAGECLVFLGRTDFQVKLRGFRIELGEIEAALSARPEITEAVVALREDRPGDKRLVAYVVAEEASVNRTELMEYLKQNLPDYMVPAAYVVLSTMPMTANGKIDREALPAPMADEGAGGASYVAASSDIEQALVDIWRAVLGVARIGIHDNFFDLGGHSMLMTQVKRRIKEHLDKDLDMVVLFRHPTIAALAGRLTGDHDDTQAARTGRDRAQKQKDARQKRKDMMARKNKNGR